MATNSGPHEIPEYRIFREHYDRLVAAISDPLPLATRLFARSIIDSTLLQRVNIPAFTTFQNTNTLLTAVLGRIETDPSTFDVFLSALKEDSSMKSLVESMQSKCFIFEGINYLEYSLTCHLQSGVPQKQITKFVGLIIQIWPVILCCQSLRS